MDILRRENTHGEGTHYGEGTYYGEGTHLEWGHTRGGTYMVRKLHGTGITLREDTHREETHTERRHTRKRDTHGVGTYMER